MHTISSLGWLFAALSLTGCATHASARITHTLPGVSATVHTDSQFGVVASVLGAALATDDPSQGLARASVHTPGINLQRTALNPPVLRSVLSGASPTLGANPRVTTGVVSGVTLESVVTSGPGEVFAGGSITLRGAPEVINLRVIEGSLALRSQQAEEPVRAVGARHARGEHGFRVQSGIVLLATPDGRRWRARVDGGELRCETEGTLPSGRTVFVPAGGSLEVSVIAEGNSELSLTVGSGSGSASARGTQPTDLGVRVTTALNLLLEAIPASSPESLRMASAVRSVINTAQSDHPEFYSVPVVGRAVVFVVDVSYSMGDLDPGATDLVLARGADARKLDVARAELVKVLAQVPAGVAVSVVAFSSGVHTLWAAPRVIDEPSLREAITWIANLHPEDETEPVGALRAALAMQPEQIVLLSDGRPSYRAPVAQAVLSLTASFSSSTRLDIVGIGADQDTELLTALATRGHGTLRQR